MILFIIISIPLFNANTWFDNVTIYEKGIDQLEALSRISPEVFDSEG